MREIERTARFKRDYKRERKGRHAASLDDILLSVLEKLAGDEPLPVNCRDHALSGDWSGFRDCHVKPDLVLIYEKPHPQTLRLIRLGSHSEIGL